jgi:hypothetical protein
MIMPDMRLNSRINQILFYSGMDSDVGCLDKLHFVTYPHKVEYVYNSRGFRDQEWPNSDSELASAIWCIGDNYTVGIGSPLAHTWPVRLSEQTGLRCINVSMDGASNDWIVRRAQQIAAVVKPTHMAIMWAHLHRREHSDTTRDDEHRRLHFRATHTADFFKDFIHLANCVAACDQLGSNIAHLAQPNAWFDPLDTAWLHIRDSSWPEHPPRTQQEFDEVPEKIVREFESNCCFSVPWQDYFMAWTCMLGVSQSIVMIPKMDIARDGRGFDLVTSDYAAAAMTIQLGL